MSWKQIRRTPRLCALACLFTALGMVACSGLAQPAHLAAAPSPWPAGVERAGGAPPSCLGANDLLVSGETIVMSGTEVLDHLCVTNKGKIAGSSDLRLTVGDLYVDSSSTISVDGQAGDLTEDHDCSVISGSPEGSAAHALTIAAYQATIEGSLSADGGNGMAYSPGCSNVVNPGQAGDGGSISVTAQHLAVSGPLSAHGGAGGDATTPTYESSLGPSSKPSGAGGNGGHINLSAPASDLAGVHATLDAAAGSAGKPGNGGRGRAGRAGTIQRVPLSRTASAALPPEPTSLLASAAGAPAIHVGSATSPKTLPCGSGDLVVPAGTTRILSGVQQFAHVCISGTVRVTSTLTLVAQTIDIAGTGEISADGRSPLPFLWSDSGRYGTAGACSATHAAGHAGVRGPVTAHSFDTSDDIPDLSARPGEGGGSVTLIADTLAIQGQVHADGGAGQDAFSITNINGIETWTGSGGGSGGGITIYAHQLALNGRITAIGGVGGKGSGPGHVDGAPGSGGCVKVFAGQIDAAQATANIAGSAFFAALDPADPVAPPLQVGNGSYVAATHHTLSEPFLGYWRAHGGVTTLGYPLTEAFSEHGVLEQYTERALLTSAGGSVQVAALGTTLTAARHFPRISKAGAAARFFAATGHSLGGRFLTYWLAHQGATVLGAPISEVLDEGNGDGSGRRYQLQWFERGRLEYHPENTGPYTMELGLVGRDALRARGWLPAPSSSVKPANPEAGRVPGAKLYALEANGDVFESDGSTAWRYQWGSIPDPGKCGVNTIAATTDGAVAYVTSASAATVGDPQAPAVCPLLWSSVHGTLQPVPAGELPRDDRGDGPGLLVAPGGTVYIWKQYLVVAKSTDSGATWSRVPLPSKEVQDVVLDPSRPGHLWVDLRSGTPTRLHIYASTDAGDSWQEVPTVGTPIATQPMPLPMAVDPRSNAALWVGTNHGLYHTVDAGKTWVHVGGGLPPALFVDGLAVSPFDTRIILAWREGTGLFSSADGGRTWQRSPGPVAKDSYCRATFDPLNRLHIYLACDAGVYVSDDGGRTWSNGTNIDGDGEVLASHSHPGLAYVVGWDRRSTAIFTLGKVFRTTDGGVTWQPWAGGDMLENDTIVGIAGFVP